MNFKKLLFPFTESTSEVTILRNVLVRGKPFDAGVTASFPESIARDLVSQGAAFSNENNAEAEAAFARLETLLPAPGEPLPCPDSWKHLPAPFASWWTLNQAGCVILNRAAEIEDRLLKKISRYSMPGDLASIEIQPNRANRNALIAGAAKGILIGELPKEYISECEYLRDANERAQQSVADWRERNGDDLLRLKLKCSDEVMASHGALTRTARELIATGRAIFETRISALGLSESKINELFYNSADYLKYKSPALIPVLQNVRVGWFLEEGKDQSHYIDCTVPSLAYLWEQYTGLDSDLVKLAKAAKSELATARRVSQAA